MNSNNNNSISIIKSVYSGPVVQGSGLMVKPWVTGLWALGSECGEGFGDTPSLYHTKPSIPYTLNPKP